MPDTQPSTRRKRTTDLVGTTDAQEWARAFAHTREEVRKAGRGDIADDEMTMVSWFANAIESGRDAEATKVIAIRVGWRAFDGGWGRPWEGWRRRDHSGHQVVGRAFTRRGAMRKARRA